MATQNLKVKEQEKGILPTTLKKKRNFGGSLASFILLASIAYLFYKRKLFWVK